MFKKQKNEMKSMRIIESHWKLTKKGTLIKINWNVERGLQLRQYAQLPPLDVKWQWQSGIVVACQNA